MKLIEFYIFRRTAQMFLVTLLPILAVIWTIQVLGRINLVTDTGQSMGSFMTLATYILPTIVPVVLPFALVIGIAQTLTAMNTDSELPVIDAAGASRSVILKPVLILCAALSLFSFVTTNFIEPYSRASARQMVASAYADLLSSVIEEKTFRTIQDGLYVQISQRLSGRVLKGLLVADQRDPNFDLMYYAKEGLVDEGGTSLTMRNGEVHRKSTDGKVSVIKFDSYAFDLSSMSGSTGGPSYYASDRTFNELVEPDISDPAILREIPEYRAELHRRLTDWTLPLVFGLITLVLAGDARSHREARLHPMVGALIIAFVIRWVSFSIYNQSQHNAFFVALIYAVPILSIGICAILLRRARKYRFEAAVAGRVGTGLHKLGKLLPGQQEPKQGGGA